MQRGSFDIKAQAPEVPVAEDPLAEELGALAAVGAPALVAVGEHDMPDFHAAADEIVEALPNARRVVIAVAGHLAPLEQPQAILALVTDLTRCGAVQAEQPHRPGSRRVIWVRGEARR